MKKTPEVLVSLSDILWFISYTEAKQFHLPMNCATEMHLKNGDRFGVVRFDLTYEDAYAAFQEMCQSRNKRVVRKV